MLAEYQQICLDGTWDFTPGHLFCDEDPNYINGNKIDWHDIEVPYCWNGSKWMTVLGEYYTKNGYYKDHEIPPFRDHQGVGWYKKELTIQENWLKKRIHIHFAGVSAKAQIWVNGQEVGQHLGAYSSFHWDITDYLYRNGEVETIVVKVWDKSCFYPSDDASFNKHKINTKVLGRRTLIPVGETRNNGGIDQPVHLFATDATYIKDMDLKTEENSFSATVHVRRKELFGSCYTLKARVIDIKTSVVVYEGIKETQIPHEEMSFLFSSQDLDVKQWWPHAPHLYRFEVSIMKEDCDYGSYSKIIGFKTFKIKNGKFNLNGHPYFLRGAGSPPHTMILHDQAYIDKFMNYCQKFNINCIRFHTEPPSQRWLDACDQYGMLVIYEMPLMQQAPDPINTRNEFKAMVKQVKHHPSLAIYCLSNELDHFQNIVDPIGYKEHHIYLNDLAEAVREIDDTLPVYNNAGLKDLRTCGDIKDIHSYSGWYGQAIIAYEKNIRQIPDEDGYPSSMYFGSWKNRIETDNHKPLILTEFIGAYTDNEGRFYQVPASWRFIGKDPDENNERALWYQAHLIEESVEIFRRERNDSNNFSGFAPFALFNWFFNPLSTENIRPKPAAEVLEKILEPLHVSIRCHHKRIFFGKPLNAEIHLIHDDVRYKLLKDSKVICRVFNHDQKVYEENIQIQQIDYYSNKVIPLSIQLDLSADELEEANLHLEVDWVNDQSTLLSTNQMDFKIFGKQKGLDVGKELYIFDPQDKLDTIFKNQGYQVKLVEDFGRLNEIHHLVIGCNALKQMNSSQIGQLQCAIRKGTNLLVLEQNLFEMELTELEIDWVDGTPLKLVKEGRGIDDYVYVNDATSPIFDGLAKEDFREWNGDTIIISSYLQQGDDSRKVPAKTKLGSRFGFNVDKYKHVKSHVACSNFLRNDGLIELSMGKGKVLFSQLEACRRYGEDPVATLFLNNLLKYLIENNQS
ncbi:sugar-binding domain-containing protein [Vallitalea okinawensis]|uniref:sugar-binding domain-containing protein n=1 Tax=Vallitalea okinawensis TaxID=2078660 RepID=UPI000CFCCB61|nr:sugar-binding domain-containing protein [Vallitalea okinawensis]